MFTDRVNVELTAGKGGNGVVAWRREKYVPKGGPCGGNGGHGGSIILCADAQIPSLDWFRNRRQIKGENGGQGGGNNRKGKDGKNVVLKVPCGTLVKDSETGLVIADLTHDQEKFEICKGGRGGRGNNSFKTPTHQAPNICTPGRPGEQVRVELELKLIAEVGLVGFPNAGKSTLLSAITNANVKCAAYPFTTLVPHLGFIKTEQGERIQLADIPGIIEGAHQNRGLGLEFLRHIERTKVLLFMLDASGIDGRTPYEDWKTLRHEIGEYDSALLERPFLIALNKVDADGAQANLEEFYSHVHLHPHLVYEISAVLGTGLDSVVRKLDEIISGFRPAKAVEYEDKEDTIDEDAINDENDRTIER